MAVVPENQRIAELLRLGISEQLIRLSSGEAVHEMFRYGCLGPPYYVYHEAGTPEGPPLVPLWDCNNTVLGIWERPDGLEYIEFSIEAHSEYTTLARTEQGFWAAQFDFFYESGVSLEELRESAAVVGFRYFDRQLASRELEGSRLTTFEGHAAWLRDLVARIDRESGGSAEPS